MVERSIPVDKKRRGRPPGTKFKAPVPLRLTSEMMVSVDHFVADRPDPKPSRSEAIRILLREALTSLGYLKHRDDPEGAN